MGSSSTNATREWRRRLLSLLAIASVAAVVVSAALADGTAVDGDTAKSSNNVQYQPTANAASEACSTRGSAVAGRVRVTYNGGTHFTVGGTVTASVTPSAEAAAAGITASGGSATVPAGYNANGDTFDIAISTTVPAAAGDGTYTISVVTSGAGTGSQAPGGVYTFNDSFSVSIACATPTVTINEATGQSDPTDTSPINFTATFSENVTGFDAFDVNLAGTAGATTAAVTGGPKVYNVAVSGMTGNGTVTAAIPANAANDVSGNGNTISTSTDNTVVYFVAPPNTAPTVAFDAGTPTAANEGDTRTLNFTITDPDADTWSFATGYPKCGDNGSLVSGSATITAKSGTFQCTFPDGPSNSTAAAKVNDGTADSNEATNAVAVSNVKPTVGIDSVSGNSGTACIDGNQVTLGFSWTDPAGTNDPYEYTVNWGHGANTTGSNATSPVSGLTHTYPAGGPYTVQITVNDGDPGDPGSASTTAFSFLYDTSGILQPVNDTRNGQEISRFKYKSTIPVKIRVTDCDNVPVSNLTLTVSFLKLSASPPPEGVDESASTVPPTDGTTMRWDAVAQQYIYNLATKQLTDSSATYRIKVTGSTIGQVYSDIGIKP